MCGQVQWVHLAHKFASLHECCYTSAFTTAHGTQHMCTMFCNFSLGSVLVAFTSSIVCSPKTCVMMLLMSEDIADAYTSNGKKEGNEIIKKHVWCAHVEEDVFLVGQH